MPDGVTRIIPLGGLGEVGKNMTVFEAGDDAIVVDAGLAFPRDEHLGVDLLIPDLGYLRDRGGRVRAVVLTHGHEDHVGALPFVLRELRVDEVWATKLTLGLVSSKLDEHGLLRASELRELTPGEPFELGAFRVGTVRVAHSIPDSVAVVLESPGGRILVTVSQNDRLDVLRALAEVGEVGQHEVDAELVGRREHEARVDDDQPVLVLDHRHVLADLPQAAQGKHAQLAAQTALRSPWRSSAARMTAFSSSEHSTIGSRKPPTGWPNMPIAVLIGIGLVVTLIASNTG